MSNARTPSQDPGTDPAGKPDRGLEVPCAIKTNSFAKFVRVAATALFVAVSAPALDVYLTDVPDYGWYYACTGTATGNLMGYWDRHGFPGFYTGQVNGGVAPLNSQGANAAISSLWVSCAGVDGRPPNRPGHSDDYYRVFGDAQPDPYLVLGRAEHAPDCLGDFMGMDQLKWTNQAGECDGNIDGFSFVYWATNGERRVNFVPGAEAGEPVRDVQSGLRAWTQYRGYDCTVFTQLVDFNPHSPPGTGFTFADLQAEIDAGYPVLLLLQNYDEFSRAVDPLPRANPQIHTMLAYGYYQAASGASYVRYMTSWAEGPKLSSWEPQTWQAGMPVRGVIGYRPLPKLRNCSLDQGRLSLRWDGPAANLLRSTTGTQRVHGYVVEMASALAGADFVPISDVLLTNAFTVTNCSNVAFFRIKLVKP